MKTKKLKFFLIDDDPFHLSIMTKMLNNAGHTQLHTFQNGLDALNEIHQNPDVIFLDHNMDLYNGFEVLRKIKRYNPDACVIMVSGQESINTAISSLKYGAFDYLQKDENLESALNGVIERFINLKKLMNSKKRRFFTALFSF